MNEAGIANNPKFRIRCKNVLKFNYMIALTIPPFTPAKWIDKYVLIIKKTVSNTKSRT